MKAFIVNVSQLFSLDTQNSEESNFSADKRKLLIPLYQREYKWEDKNIQSIVNDIKNHEKFLGNIILDEANDCYEIVDGQQRITTCFLLLLSIHNRYQGHMLEQQDIDSLVRPYGGEYILRNDTIGDFVIEKNGLYDISISETNDIYYQKTNFMRAFNTINCIIGGLDSLEKVYDIKQKLQGCQFLVLINNEHSYSKPVEQIFLDINEKAQLLDPEDIFKGHCFENYYEKSYKDLRGMWVQLKKCGMGFTKFGYSHLSQYIYTYFIEYVNSNISTRIELKGRHYLEGKSADDTMKLLHDMIEYGEDVMDFYNKLNQTDYEFVDLCNKSNDYRNTQNSKLLKILCKEMLESTKAQYQKFPLMHFVHFLKNNRNISDEIEYNDFRKIIINLYIYMSLFIIIRGKKSKSDLDHSFYETLQEGEINISKAVDAAKKLRKDKVDTYIFKSKFEYEELSFIYSVIDFYVSNSNWLKNKYTRETGHNLEHFIIPDNKATHFSWKILDRKKKFNLLKLPTSQTR